LGRRREEMRRTAIETAAGEWGRSGGEAAPAFGGGEGVVGKGMQWSGVWRKGKKRGVCCRWGGGWSRATMICFSRGFRRTSRLPPPGFSGCTLSTPADQHHHPRQAALLLPCPRPQNRVCFLLAAPYKVQESQVCPCTGSRKVLGSYLSVFFFEKNV